MTAAIRIHHQQPSRTARSVHDLRERRVMSAPVRAAGARPSEATFRRRRAIVGTTLAVFVAVGVVATHDVLAGSGGDPASAAVSQPAHVTSVVARPGDTLWSIADRFRGGISISRYVDTLVDINGGASIEVGQTILLP